MKKENTPLIILVSGKKRAGKDTVSSMVKQHLEERGKKVAIFSFADPIRKILSCALDVGADELMNTYQNNGIVSICSADGSVIKQTSARSMLQRFGDEGMKDEFGRMVWAELATNKARRALGDGFDVIVFSDFRVPEELEAIKKLSLQEGGAKIVTLLVKSSNIENGCADEKHRTETALETFLFDFSILNSKARGIEALRDKIHVLLQNNFFFTASKECAERHNTPEPLFCESESGDIRGFASKAKKIRQ